MTKGKFRAAKRLVASPSGFIGAAPRLGVATSAPAPVIQTKLEVGTPNDKFEQEADRVADQVVRIPDRSLQRTGDHPRPQLSIQHRMTGSESGSIAPSVVQEALHSASRPLDASTRAFMEPRFGHDFSKVRVHAEAQAAESARFLNASAYTVGQDIVFGPGQYSPLSADGKWLLAHELAHTVQQGGVSTANGQTTHSGIAVMPNGPIYGPQPPPRRRRSLTGSEVSEASKVYQGGLKLPRFEIIEDSTITFGGYARSLRDALYLPSSLFSSTPMSLLIHELMHQWQYQHGYWVPTLLWNAFKKYDYGGEDGLRAAADAGRSITSFNTEQQGDIMEDFYERTKNGQDVTAWMPFVEEVQKA